MTDFYNSWYFASRNWQADFPVLTESVRADVCVLGGGITGLTTALNLAEKGYSVVLLEAHEIGFGASGRSGGQMIFGLAAEQPTIEKLVGKDDARKIWQSSVEGLDLLRQRISQHNIECDFQPGHAHVAIKPRQARDLHEWSETLAKDYNYHSLEYWPEERVRSEVNSERYIAGLYDSNSGHLHPLNYTLGLAKAAAAAGVQIYQQSAATAVQEGEPVLISTAQGQVSADYFVLAGNAYLSGLTTPLTNKIMPVGTYICASEPLGEERARQLLPSNLAVADINFVLDYFRLSHDWRMLFGGRVSYSTLPPPNLAQAMGKRMRTVFPSLGDVNIDYAWGGFVAITMNRAPHFGRLSKNIFFAQGFSGHGIAATGLAGKLMADAIAGTAERFDVFSRIPHHTFPGGRLLRTPALVLAMAWFRLQDLLP
ncbi:FAD-binding oxidoreductase [Halioxenophilus sp. WMMB6]|uniref:NAD(P)/FAD-dependent oxidoreductase n=1 Tax=Halioxenophilus sp. WMMB6 TaxID=3073815 RepID=UPI00295E4CFB|nr:FAD-binding oxidoreductase [Halioxenophilus sp. WMMB6]